MHGVHGEVGGDGALGGGEALGYDCSSINSTSSRRMPKGPGVSVQILPNLLAMLLRRHVEGRGGERKDRQSEARGDVLEQ